MNKQEFLVILRESLVGLPREDIERSVDYYSEMIDDRMEDGLSEEEAVNAVGSFEEIISQILTEVSLPKLVKERVKPSHALKTWEILLLIIGAPLWLPLLVALAAVVLAVCLVIWSIIVALYAVNLSFLIVGIAGICGFVVSVFSGSGTQAMLSLGAGLVGAGITILLFLGFNQITKGILFLSKKVLLGVKACFIGRER